MRQKKKLQFKDFFGKFKVEIVPRIDCISGYVMATVACCLQNKAAKTRELCCTVVCMQELKARQNDSRNTVLLRLPGDMLELA